MTDAEFLTEDLALVATLKVRGCEALRLERIGDGCRWIYRHTDGLQQVLDEYWAEESYVEPKEFAKKMGQVRREMYQFLGHQPKRIRQ